MCLVKGCPDVGTFNGKQKCNLDLCFKHSHVSDFENDCSANDALLSFNNNLKEEITPTTKLKVNKRKNNKDKSQNKKNDKEKAQNKQNNESKDIDKKKSKKQSNERRKEKSRDAARFRRSKECELYNSLSSSLPLPHDVLSGLDKASIMRIGIAWLDTVNMIRTALTSSIVQDYQETTDVSLSSPDRNIHQELLLQALDGFFLVLSSSGRVDYVSPTIAHHLGLPEVDVLGVPLSDLVHQCDHEDLRKLLKVPPVHKTEVQTVKSELKEEENQYDEEEAREAGVRPISPLVTESRHGFLRIKSTLANKGRNVTIKNASYKVMEICGKMVSSSGGSAWLMCVAQPVPHPANIEVPLDSRTYFSKHSLDMKFTYADENFPQFCGFTPSQLEGKSLFQLHHELDGPLLRRCFNTLCTKGQVSTGQYRFLASGGGYVWLVTQATVIHSSNKENTPSAVVCLHYVISGVQCTNEIVSCIQLTDKNNGSQLASGGGGGVPGALSGGSGLHCPQQDMLSSYTSAGQTRNASCSVQGIVDATTISHPLDELAVISVTAEPVTVEQVYQLSLPEQYSAPFGDGVAPLLSQGAHQLIPQTDPQEHTEDFSPDDTFCSSTADLFCSDTVDYSLEADFGQYCLGESSTESLFSEPLSTDGSSLPSKMGSISTAIPSEKCKAADDFDSRAPYLPISEDDTLVFWTPELQEKGMRNISEVYEDNILGLSSPKIDDIYGPDGSLNLDCLKGDQSLSGENDVSQFTLFDNPLSPSRADLMDGTLKGVPPGPSSLDIYPKMCVDPNTVWQRNSEGHTTFDGEEEEPILQNVSDSPQGSSLSPAFASLDPFPQCEPDQPASKRLAIPSPPSQRKRQRNSPDYVENVFGDVAVNFEDFLSHEPTTLSLPPPTPILQKLLVSKSIPQKYSLPLHQHISSSKQSIGCDSVLRNLLSKGKDESERHYRLLPNTDSKSAKESDGSCDNTCYSKDVKPKELKKGFLKTESSSNPSLIASKSNLKQTFVQTDDIFAKTVVDKKSFTAKQPIFLKKYYAGGIKIVQMPSVARSSLVNTPRFVLAQESDAEECLNVAPKIPKKTMMAKEEEKVERRSSSQVKIVPRIRVVNNYSSVRRDSNSPSLPYAKNRVEGRFKRKEFAKGGAPFSVIMRDKRRTSTSNALVVEQMTAIKKDSSDEWNGNPEIRSLLTTGTDFSPSNLVSLTQRDFDVNAPAPTNLLCGQAILEALE